MKALMIAVSIACLGLGACCHSKAHQAQKAQCVGCEKKDANGACPCGCGGDPAKCQCAKDGKTCCDKQGCECKCDGDPSKCTCKK